MLIFLILATTLSHSETWQGDLVYVYIYIYIYLSIDYLIFKVNLINSIEVKFSDQMEHLLLFKVDIPHETTLPDAVSDTLLPELPLKKIAVPQIWCVCA